MEGRWLLNRVEDEDSLKKEVVKNYSWIVHKKAATFSESYIFPILMSANNDLYAYHKFHTNHILSP